METCKACGTSESLINSHIIPEWAYKSVYTGKHKFGAITATQSGKIIAEQKGFREPLLCKKCETYLSKLENRLFRDVKQIRLGIRQVAISNGIACAFAEKTIASYAIFKKAILSILWRMSISSRDEFKNYSLGKKVEEHLRKLVFDPRAAVSWATYPIAVFRLTIGRKLANGMMLLIQEADFAPGIKAQSFAIYGLKFIVYIYFPTAESSINTQIMRLQNVVVNESGGLIVSDIDAVPMLKTAKIYGRLQSEDVIDFYKRYS